MIADYFRELSRNRLLPNFLGTTAPIALCHPRSPIQRFLRFVIDLVAASVAYFISLEMRSLIGTFCWIGFLAMVGDCALITALGIETIVHVSVEVVRALKPRARADKGAIDKPFRAVVAVGSTGVGGIIK